MNVNSLITTDYEIFLPLAGQKNKPNSNPIKPNLQKAQMNVNLYVIEDYENEPPFGSKKTNPKQSQFQRPKSHAGKSGPSEPGTLDLTKDKWYRVIVNMTHSSIRKGVKTNASAIKSS